ncbi:MAG TPA: SRPBCC family protein [Mycobacterium sp.]
MVEIHLERTIAAPVEQVFDYLADPAGLTAPPPVLRAHWVKGSTAPAVGAVREVIGVGVWFREEITAYERPHSYSYLILHSFPPFNHDGGTLTFTPADGGTHVDWLTNYTHPAYAGGRLTEAVTRRLLRASFSDILDGCANALKHR